MQASTMARRKGGRPRKAGPREASGRPKRMSAKVREEDVRALAVEARCRLMGWPATPSNLNEARRPIYGTTEGRLYMADAISAREYEAIRTYATLRRDYRRLISLPPETAQGMDLTGTRGGGGTEPHEARIKRVAGEYMAALGVLGAVSQHTEGLLLSIINDQLGVWEWNADSLAHLRRAAGALAEHFRIDIRD